MIAPGTMSRQGICFGVSNLKATTKSPTLTAREVTTAPATARPPWCPIVTSPATTVLTRRNSPRTTIMEYVRPRRAQKLGRFTPGMFQISDCAYCAVCIAPCEPHSTTMIPTTNPKMLRP